MGVCGGGLEGSSENRCSLNLRETRSTFEKLFSPANTLIHISLSLLESALFSAETAHTHLPQFPFFFCVFFLPSLTLNETTMSRLSSKDDQKSVVSLTHYYSTQYSKAAHTGASRGLLYCVVHGHAHVRLRLLHFRAILFFYFHNHSPGCGVQDGMCRRWGLNEVRVKFEK